MNKVQPTTCQATSNLEISIPDTQGHNIVLYFYPKDATPGCTTEGQDFRGNHQAFLDANTIIYGVSKDDLTKHEKFKTKQAFPFELIADVEGDLCEAFDVWQLKKFMSHQRDANAANLLTSSISTLLIILALLAKPLQHDL
jgi:peroxiredoxin Q/BCP